MQSGSHGGFASMDRDKQREIARKGGMAAHRKGTAHEFTADEARNAGRKGGQQVSADRNHMIEIGRIGGLRSALRRKLKATEQKTVNPGADNRAESQTEDMTLSAS